MKEEQIGKKIIIRATRSDDFGAHNDELKEVNIHALEMAADALDRGVFCLVEITNNILKAYEKLIENKNGTCSAIEFSYDEERAEFVSERVTMLLAY